MNDKMKYLLIVIVFLLFVLIIYFVSQNNYEPSLKTISLPGDKISCEGIGGYWESISFSENGYCNKMTSDAGKECIDSDECEGHCITNISPDEFQKIQENGYVEAKGTCSDRMILTGCHGRVEDNRLAVTLCVDK